MKGLVLINITSDKYDSVQLIKFLFNRIRTERVSYTKHVVRLIPFQYVSFPGIEELDRLCGVMVVKEFPSSSVAHVEVEAPTSACSSSESSSNSGSTDAVSADNSSTEAVGEEQPSKRIKLTSETLGSSVPTSPIQYAILFKNRSSSSVVKSDVYNSIFQAMPRGITKSNYLQPEVSVVSVVSVEDVS